MKITQQQELWAHCRKFIEDNRITCPETVHQCDWVIEHAYEFIEGVCDIVGYISVEEADTLDDKARSERRAGK